jgi:hypothetical protein
MDHEDIRGSSQHRRRWASGIFGGDERDRCCCRAARGRRSAQQSRREFASALSATRTGDAAVSKSEDAAEVQLSSCPGAQPIQSGALSRHEADLQAKTLCCLGRVARSRGIDRRARDGGRCMSTSLRYFDTSFVGLQRLTHSKKMSSAHITWSSRVRHRNSRVSCFRRIGRPMLVRCRRRTLELLPVAACRD